jgi:hypothetical protein
MASYFRSDLGDNAAKETNVCSSSKGAGPETRSRRIDVLGLSRAVGSLRAEGLILGAPAQISADAGGKFL